MTTVQVTRNIPFGADRVWPVLADFGGVHRFHPLVARSPIINGRVQGVGAERRCDFHDGNHVKERITQWDEGRSIAIEILEGSMPLKSAQGTISVAPTSPNRCEVSFQMEYVPKFGPLGRLMDVLMIQRKFAQTLGQVLEGLERYLRTDARKSSTVPMSEARVAPAE